MNIGDMNTEETRDRANTSRSFTMDGRLCLACNWQLFSESLMEVNPDYEKPITIRNRTGKPDEGDDYAEAWKYVLKDLGANRARNLSSLRGGK